MTTFAELGLIPELLRSIGDSGYTKPQAIQERAIPVALRGADLIGLAQTGTGKTAAFLLPTLQRLHQGGRGRFRALVLTPTRELAAQVLESARVYGRHLPIRSAVIFGGVGYGEQRDALRTGVDILVATPGRLLDFMGDGAVDFRHLEVLVLDEADRMLDMGFLPDVRRILRALPQKRQTLLFSATLPDEIETVIRDNLKAPELIEIGRRSKTVDAVRQWQISVVEEHKRDLLCHLLRRSDLQHVLVFTRTKARADRVARHLERAGIEAIAIHGNKSQNQRVRALDQFRSYKIGVLVATDIAARGIDVDGISHVINFDVSNVPEDYVHRIGRTARNEATGEAISLVSPDDRGNIRDIERLTGVAIAPMEVEGFVPPPPSAFREHHARSSAPRGGGGGRGQHARKPQGRSGGRPSGRFGGHGRGGGSRTGHSEAPPAQSREHQPPAAEPANAEPFGVGLVDTHGHGSSQNRGRVHGHSPGDRPPSTPHHTGGGGAKKGFRRRRRR